GSPATLAGWLSASRVNWTPVWLSQPVMLHNVRIEAGQSRIRATGLVAELGESTITGTMERALDKDGRPRWQADLRVNDISATGLAGLFSTGRPVPPWMSNLQAGGKITASLFHLRSLQLQDLQSN